MNTAKNDPPVASNLQTSGESPKVIHLWEDFPTLMRHASRARAAGDLPRACTFYTRATELNSNSAEAWTGRASTTSNVDEAIVSRGYALALEPNDETHSALSVRVSEKIAQSRAKDVPSLVAVGRRLAQAGQWAFAHDLLLRATELDPSNENAWMWRAGVTHDVTETIVCLNHVLELNPLNAQAKAGLKWAAAKRTAEPVAPDLSQQAATLLEEGQRALREGDRVRAYELFHRATELDPQNASAWFWSGSTAPNVDEALNCMERVLAIDPENEAAKDARWWLRVQSLRERSPALAHTEPVPPPVISAVEPRIEKPSRIAPLIALILLACLAGGLTILIWAAWYAGYF